MNDNKSRLRDYDEIMQSIGKMVRQPQPEEPAVPTGGQGSPDRRRGRTPKVVTPIQEEEAEETPVAVAQTAKETPRRRGRPPRTQQELDERVQRADARPLDFGKYELTRPQPGGAHPPAAQSAQTKPEADEDSGLEDLREFSFESFEDSAPPTPQAVPRTQQSADKAVPRSRVKANPTPAAQPQTEQTAPQRTSAQEIRGAEQAVRQQEPQVGGDRAQAVPAPAVEQPAVEPDKPMDVFTLAEDERTRSRFMKELGSKFEEQFSRLFDNGLSQQEQQERSPAQPPPAPEKPEPSVQPAPLPEPEPELEPELVMFPPTEASESEPVPRQQIPAPPDEEAQIRQETETFLQNFVEETKQQEEVQQQDFKETLAEKFMRERERYLRELGISEMMEREQQGLPLDPEEEPEPELAQPEEPVRHSPRRVLDFHIQPEMHLREGETPPVRPVTYGRNAMTRPLDEAELEAVELPYLPEQHSDETSPALSSARQDKKSAEQLLLELAASNSIKQAPFPVEEPPLKKRKKAQKKRQEQVQKPALPFAHVEEEVAEQEEKNTARPRRKPNKMTMIAIGGLTCAVLLVALLIWIPVSVLLSNRDADGSAIVTPGQAAAASSGTEKIYETRERMSQRRHYVDAAIMKADITLEDTTVENSLIIEDIPTPGAITLNDVDVKTIYVYGSAVHTLNLQQVKAERIVVNNEQTTVALNLGEGNDITTIEAKTAVEVVELQPGVGAQAVENVNLNGTQYEKALEVSLGALALQRISAEGDAILSLEGTTAETMTAEGSLSMEGTGKVYSLTASQREEKTLSVILKGVEVTSLYLNSPAYVNVSAPVVSVYTSDNLTLAGNGTIGSLSVNEQFGTARLALDISSLNVQTVTANTEVLVNSAGSTQINTLTANESVYALGNKVNHLEVNAPGVIYENRPDRITVASGIQPPQTVAENPQINFNLTTRENTGERDVSGDDVATTCNDPRESGGYIRGEGSADYPFEVATPAQLAHVSSHPNSHFIQTADIDFSDDSQFSSGMTPIASFSGVYDGNGYQIKNVRINSAGEHVGLFERNSGMIKNVNLVSGEINGEGGGSSYVGGLVGFNGQNGIVVACSNGARIGAPNGANAGGIVGYNFGGKIQDCYNYAKVSGSGTIGGLAATNLSGAVIVSSYNVGTIEGEGSAGAVAGHNDATITNCYFLADTAAAATGNGSGSATEVTSAQLQGDQMIADLSVGSADSPWIKGSGSYDYPMLKAPDFQTRGEESSFTPNFIPPESSGEEAPSSSNDTEPGDDEPPTETETVIEI